MDRKIVIEKLHAEGCSCVVACGESVSFFYRKGIIDLYEALVSSREVLYGAFVADKVVGKGAAALMIAGGVTGVYADVISVPALALFESHGVEVGFGECVGGIINRRGDGMCPVETLCKDCDEIDECVSRIGKFLSSR